MFFFFLKLSSLYFICVPHALRPFFTVLQGYLKVSVAVLGPNDQRVAYELEDGGNSSSSSSSSSARNSADSSVERNADGWEIIKNCEYPKAMKLKSWGIKANLFRAEHLPVSGTAHAPVTRAKKSEAPSKVANFQCNNIVSVFHHTQNSQTKFRLNLGDTLKRVSLQEEYCEKYHSQSPQSCTA
jgi:hypothetical protein